jgi:hypothetical protein
MEQFLLEIVRGAEANVTVFVRSAIVYAASVTVLVAIANYSVRCQIFRFGTYFI